MPRTLLQNEQTDLDFPLRMRATLPSPDAWLNFSPSSLPATGDGLSQSVTPLGSTLPSVPLTRVNFQTGATSGGTFNGLLPFPVTTVGDYRRVGFALLPNGQIKVKWSAQSATLVGLQNPGKLVSSGGLPIGWIDLQATSSTAYKTAGSATNIIENDVAGVSRINIFAPGAGGGGVFEQQIANGQVVPADIEDLLLDENESKIAHVLYGITRVYEESVSGGTSLNTSFVSNSSDGAKFNAAVDGVYTQADGKVLVAGTFTNYDGVTGRNHLVRLNADGSVDSAFCVNASDGGKFNQFVDPFIATVPKQNVLELSSGKILVTGYFTNYNSVSGRSYCILLNADGTTDVSFTSAYLDGNFNNPVTGAIEQPDGKLLIFGFFTNFDGVTGRDCLVRLNADGTLDASFCVNASDGSKFDTSGIYEVRLLSDSSIIVFGAFANYDGISGQDYLIKLNPGGTLNSTFATNINGQWAGILPVPKSMAFVRSDDKIFVSYLVNTLYGESLLAVVNPDGTFDAATTATFAPPGRFTTNGAYSILELPDGRLVWGSDSTDIDGVTGLNGFVILNADGSLDLSSSLAIAGLNLLPPISEHVFAYRASDELLLISSISLTDYGGVVGRDYLVAFDMSGGIPITERITQGEIAASYSYGAGGWAILDDNWVGDTPEVILSLSTSGQFQYTSSSLSGTEVDSKLRYQLRNL